MRQQTSAGSTARKDLENGKNSVAELFVKVREIKAKAESSENMVHEICRDIKYGACSNPQTGRMRMLPLRTRAPCCQRRAVCARRRPTRSRRAALPSYGKADSARGLRRRLAPAQHGSAFELRN